TERRLLEVICSYRGTLGNWLELNGDGAPRRVVGLEVLAGPEAEAAGEQVGGEALDAGVKGPNGLVVELPRVRDAPLRRGQLLLEREEVLVGLQVGILLRHREQRLQRRGDLVLGLGLLRDALGADGVRPRLGDG